MIKKRDISSKGTVFVLANPLVSAGQQLILKLLAGYKLGLWFLLLGAFTCCPPAVFKKPTDKSSSTHSDDHDSPDWGMIPDAHPLEQHSDDSESDTCREPLGPLSEAELFDLLQKDDVATFKTLHQAGRIAPIVEEEGAPELYRLLTYVQNKNKERKTITPTQCIQYVFQQDPKQAGYVNKSNSVLWHAGLYAGWAGESGQALFTSMLNQLEEKKLLDILQSSYKTKKGKEYFFIKIALINWHSAIIWLLINRLESLSSVSVEEIKKMKEIKNKSVLRIVKQIKNKKEITPQEQANWTKIEQYCNDLYKTN